MVAMMIAPKRLERTRNKAGRTELLKTTKRASAWACISFKVSLAR